MRRLQQVGILALAYALCCACAVVVAYFIFGLTITIQSGSSTAIAAAPVFFSMGMMITLATAWPGFLVTHILIWIDHFKTHPVFFALAGGLTAFLATMIFTQLDRHVFANFWFAWPAGAVAGLVYGLVWQKWPLLCALLAPSQSRPQGH